MPSGAIAAVMVHVGDVAQALAWYAKGFPAAVRSVAGGTDFELLCVGDVQIEIVRADEKVASSAAGTVVYWRVDDLAEALLRFAVAIESLAA